MSVNKTLALIGSIFATFLAVFYFFIGFIGSLGMLFNYDGYYSYGSYYDPTAVVLGVVLMLLSILVLAATVLNWVAFAHLDKPKDKAWKIYFLVMGILSCIVIFGVFTALEIIPGVLFILVFALPSSKPKTSLAPGFVMTDDVKANPEKDDWAWAETVTAPAADLPASTSLAADPIVEESQSNSTVSESVMTSDSVAEIAESGIKAEAEASFGWTENASDSEKGN
ncbi:hypothetical protein [Lactovum odontotermitis]